MATAVYRDFDTEAMELQYNPRLAVANVDGIVADWTARSQAFTSQHPCELDVAYGSRPEEVLDLYKPESRGGPVLIFIHGGYWRALDKQPFAFIAEPFIARGTLVASINYTLCPAVTLDEIVRQSRAACEWVWRKAAAYGGDADRIHLFGHSAGGHLAAMMAATNWPDIAADLPVDLLKSATPISGLFDLEPVRATSVNEDVRLDEEMAIRNSPADLGPSHDLPMTIAVGGAETDEFRRQSREFQTGWASRLSSIDYVETDGENHFTVIDGLVDPNSPITSAILRHMA